MIEGIERFRAAPVVTRPGCWHLIRIGPGWRWVEGEMPVRLDRAPERSGSSGKLARGMEFATQIPQFTRKPHLDKDRPTWSLTCGTACVVESRNLRRKCATDKQYCGNLRARQRARSLSWLFVLILANLPSLLLTLHFSRLTICLRRTS